MTRGAMMRAAIAAALVAAALVAASCAHSKPFPAGMVAVGGAAAAPAPCDAFSFVACGPVGLVEWLLNRSEEGRLFTWAKKRGTPDAWRHYLKLYGDGPRAVAARGMLEDVTFATASGVASSEAYREFLRRYPVSRHRTRALAGLEAAAFDEAAAANDERRLLAFLAEFPGSSSAPDARRRLEALRRAEVLKGTDALAALRFLALYPRSAGAKDVRARAEALLAQRARALRSPGMARLYQLLFANGTSAAKVADVAPAPAPASGATVTELSAIATMVPLLGRHLCFERTAQKLAALAEPYGSDAEALREKLQELTAFETLEEIDKKPPPAWCGPDAALSAVPAKVGEALALARTLVSLQTAARSAFGALHRLAMGRKELEAVSRRSKEIISKADVLEQRWQALGAPQELQDVQLNAAKLGEHVRDRAAALLAPAVQMEQRMKTLVKDVADAFVATGIAVALLAAGAP